MNSEIKLLLKPVGKIEGQFFVPSYQRGYRWGRKEATRLLEDNRSGYHGTVQLVSKNGCWDSGG